MIRKFGKNKTEESLKKARELYRQMLENTEDIGSNNPMSGNIYSAYVFMAVCRAGADKHPKYKDKTWDFNFDNDLNRDGFYYHFTRCPLEKFARDNGYLDLLPMCCDIDYLMFEKGRGVLHRKSTLASGGKICDYWIVGDKNRDPK